MDPVSLVVAALAAGAAAGVTDAASQAVKDAYAGFKSLVVRKMGGVPAGEVVVEQHAGDPATWDAPVKKAVRESSAADDPEVVEAARRLLELVDPAGAQAGKYSVNITASGERAVAMHTNAGAVSTGDTHHHSSPRS